LGTDGKGTFTLSGRSLTLIDGTGAGFILEK
jgi:hypothetical protein